MPTNLTKILKGYHSFREKYVLADKSVMQYLSDYGQSPKAMIVACCDSRVDPAVILQCDPGDLFVVRNVANIVPPYEMDGAHHGTSAALEFGLRRLDIKHLILLGHSQCAGIEALINNDPSDESDFINDWVSLIHTDHLSSKDVNLCAKEALHHSYQNCMTFPWIKDRIEQKELIIHLWFFDIKTGQIHSYSHENKVYEHLDQDSRIECY